MCLCQSSISLHQIFIKFLRLIDMCLYSCNNIFICNCMQNVISIGFPSIEPCEMEIATFCARVCVCMYLWNYHTHFVNFSSYLYREIWFILRIYLIWWHNWHSHLYSIKRIKLNFSSRAHVFGIWVQWRLQW